MMAFGGSAGCPAEVIMPYQWLYRWQGLLRLLAGFLFALLVLALVALALRVFGHGWGWFAGLVVAILLTLVARHVRRWVPRRTLLEVDFERGVVEKAPTTPPFGAAAERRPLALRDVLDALERAGDDRRVVGLLARVGSFRPGLAVAQELRDAVLAFRAKGKRAIAWAETIGEGGSATVEVYFASAFDQVHLCPVGEVGLDGVLVKHPFAKRALEKVGVKVQMDHRREYKAAMYLFTEEAFNEPHRESSTLR